MFKAFIIGLICAAIGYYEFQSPVWGFVIGFFGSIIAYLVFAIGAVWLWMKLTRGGI